MAEQQLTRYRNRATGSIVRVDDETAKSLGAEYEKADGRKAAGASSGGYAAMKVADLQAEAERRNEGRDESELIPTEGKKADLVAALEADDAAQAE